MADKTGIEWTDRRESDSAQDDPANFVMECVGKGRAGRLLDGHTWDEFPA